jgi:translocator protein
MERDSWWISGAFLVVVVAYAALSTVWVSSDPGWYDRLAKPSFQPPDLVFGLIWPLNFLALGIVGWQLGRTQPSGSALVALGVFAVSVCLALGWAYLFYVPHALVPAAACLAAAAVLTWVLVALAWRAEPWFGIGLLVYAAWLSVATALAVAYARAN